MRLPAVLSSCYERIMPNTVHRDLTASDLEHDGQDRIAMRMRIILPHWKWRIVWDWFVILLVLYNAVSIPLAIGFEHAVPHGIRAWNYIVDCVFILDIFINFRTAFVRADCELEMDFKLIARRYLHGQFCIDFVASVPIDWFITTGASNAIGAVKIPRLLRLFRLIKYFDKFAGARAVSPPSPSPLPCKKNVPHARLAGSSAFSSSRACSCSSRIGSAASGGKLVGLRGYLDGSSSRRWLTCS